MTAPARIEVHDGPALVERAVEVMGDALGAALAARGTASTALSGGSGPVPLYEAVGACGISWDGVDVFQVDERVVSTTDERSNWRMITRALLDPAAVPVNRRHPMPVEGHSPEQAASLYEHEVRRLLGSEPRFDVVVMGVGPDGHTASLFPDSPQLHEVGLVTSGPGRFEPLVPRVSLTYRALNGAELCLFYVTGADKAAAVAAALSPVGVVDDTPARGVEPESGQLIWMLDPAAAARLEPGAVPS